MSNWIRYEGIPGDHIINAIAQAIELAAKHNRKVRMRFNGMQLTVNKRLSVKHVHGTWLHMVQARQIRYRRSPEYKASQAARKAKTELDQHKLDSLMRNLPTTKEDAIGWLAKYVPLSDEFGVDRHVEAVCSMLEGLGFQANEHVGDPDFENLTASRMKRIEYLAGQVLEMLERVGCVHPILGQWAIEIADMKPVAQD